LIHGGLNSIGTSYTVSVRGSYWISSMSRLRWTTLPGVAARSSPRESFDVSTCRGQPPCVATSSMKRVTPRATLAPPVSKARLSAVGFPMRKFVGASASTSWPTANSALPPSSSSLAAEAISRIVRAQRR
jgi:hypothetical protein